MALVVPNQGESLMLQNDVNKTAPQDLVLQLYENNITPGESDTEATYTEATFPGYAEKALAGASWSVPSEGDPTEIEFAMQEFTATAAGKSVYGYIVVESSSGKLKWAERFTGAPYTLVNVGDKVQVTLKKTVE